MALLPQNRFISYFILKYFILISSLQWKVAVTLATEVDTSFEEIAYLKDLKERK